MANSGLTESPNPITADIDVQSPDGILRMLGQCDTELFLTDYDFNGTRYPGVMHQKTIDCMESIAREVEKVLKSIRSGESAAVVLSGCGTSGRLAYLVSRTANRVLSSMGLPNSFYYLIAGGDKALVTAQELQEDLPARGIKDLVQLESSFSRAVFIGISCGVSAPYVAGQLHYALQHKEKYVAAALGFNPVELARKHVSDGFCDGVPRSVYDVMLLMRESGYVLESVVGPESITGSTRLKGGSATKFLLDIIFARAFCPGVSCAEMLNDVKVSHRCMYTNIDATSMAISRVSHALKKNHLMYIGSGAFGILGFIDASEQVPTFGANPNDVRGFVAGGWDRLKTSEWSEMKYLGKTDNLFAVDIADMRPPSPDDILVIIICGRRCPVCHNGIQIPSEEWRSRLDSGQLTSLSVPCDIGLLCVWPTGAEASPCSECSGKDLLANAEFIIDLATPDTCGNVLSTKSCAETMVKWTLNALTTAAHVLKGKVYMNRMIDLRVSNSKLFYRAIFLVSLFGHVDEERAREYVVESIGIGDQDMSTLIKHAVKQENIVPVALLMALRDISVESARNLLMEHSVVRTILEGARIS